MKELKKLKRVIEKHFKIRFSDFPGEPTKKGFYVPSLHSKGINTRYWGRFVTTEVGNYFTFGDFKTNRAKRFKLDFDISGFETGEQQTPDINQYKEKRKEWRSKTRKFLKTRQAGFGEYLREFKELKPTVLTNKAESITYVPYYGVQKKIIQGLLKIDKNGKKFLTKGSEIDEVIHYVREPVSTSFLYLCEGIKTAYRVADILPSEGVASFGSIYNLEFVLKALPKELLSKVVLCTEKGSHEHYTELKYKYKTELVGSSEHGDIDDFYRELGHEDTKKLLTTFQNKEFIPLGLDKASNALRVYLKEQGRISSYKEGESKLLYADCVKATNMPDKRTASIFYFKIRDLCRKVGVISEENVIGVGAYQRGKNSFYYDGENVYLIAGKELKKLNPFEVINNETIFVKGYNKKRLDLSTLKGGLNAVEKRTILKMVEYSPNFEHLVEHQLACGFLVSSILCRIIPFRSHIWITGRTSSGKSSFARDVLSLLLKECIKKHGRETTSKWIIRGFDTKGVPFYWDEIEPDNLKKGDGSSVMELLRVTATEQVASSGKAEGNSKGTMDFKYCLQAVFTSIKILNEVGQADAERILFLKHTHKRKAGFIKAHVNFEKWVKKNDIPEKLIVTALLGYENFIKYYNGYVKKLTSFNASMHKVRCLSTLCAGYAILNKHNKIKLKDLKNAFTEQI